MDLNIVSKILEENASFGLIAFLLVYFVKSYVAGLSSTVNNLSAFMVSVKKEHESQEKHHEILIEQSKEITDILKSINNRTAYCDGKRIN